MEDELLKKAKNKHYTEPWSKISEFVPGRSSKQCNERWKNVLDPNINRTPFSPDEITILIEKHKIYGNAWKQMVKFFDRRTENMIKNQWYSAKRKSLRKRKKILQKKDLNKGFNLKNNELKKKKKKNLKIIYPKQETHKNKLNRKEIIQKYDTKNNKKVRMTLKNKSKLRKFAKKRKRKKNNLHKPKIWKNNTNSIDIYAPLRKKKIRNSNRLLKDISKHENIPLEPLYENNFFDQKKIIEFENTHLLNDVKQDFKRSIPKIRNDLYIKDYKNNIQIIDPSVFDFHLNKIPSGWPKKEIKDNSQNKLFHDCKFSNLEEY
ncbi:myb protein-related [Anaeramoeba flamelloides]|uniref:Myb protein-related n=1 Tax=Anaeramoeba flamelloides TaxID=1746091 RepID=A0AAV7Z6N6_9EUKA|nr:myb protein-related [Anaeramoeba flamelloides]